MNRKYLFSTPGSPGIETDIKALSNYTYLTSVYFTSAGELSSAVAPYTSWTL